MDTQVTSRGNIKVVVFCFCLALVIFSEFVYLKFEILKRLPFYYISPNRSNWINENLSDTHIHFSLAARRNPSTQSTFKTRRSFTRMTVSTGTPNVTDNVLKFNTSTKEAQILAGTHKRKLKCFHLFWGTFSLVLQKAFNDNCSFITNSNVIGRTGNQLFQIAAIIGLAYRFDMIPIVKDAKPVTDTFDLPNLSNYKPENTRTTGTGSCCHYAGKHVSVINSSQNWTVTGYLQSFRYFDGAEHVIRKAFRQHKHILNESVSFLKKISKANFTNVCIHYRRGDFTSERLTKLGFGIANTDYVYTAVNYFEKKLSKVQFIILSDDIKWCKENIKLNNSLYHVSPFQEVGQDMALMTSCDHVIVTSGTFGWWGAWLSGGHTVYFTGYPSPGSDVAKEFVLSEYYPQFWTGLP